MKIPPNGIGTFRSASGAGDRGFSLVEIMIVLAILAVLTAISVPYFLNYTRAYKSEDQAVKVMDLMRETAQLALNRRRTIRFELNVGNPALPFARIIDENGTDPDVVIKRIPLEPMSVIRMDAPAGVTAPNPPNYGNIGFVSGLWSARFKSDGSVVNAGDMPVSVTLYSYPSLNNTTTPKRMTEVRAITVFGGSGAVRYWKHNGTAFVPFQ